MASARARGSSLVARAVGLGCGARRAEGFRWIPRCVPAAPTNGGRISRQHRQALPPPPVAYVCRSCAAIGTRSRKPLVPRCHGFGGDILGVVLLTADVDHESVSDSSDSHRYWRERDAGGGGRHRRIGVDAAFRICEAESTATDMANMRARAGLIRMFWLTTSECP